MPFDLVGYAELAPGTGLVNVAGALGDTLYHVALDDILTKPEVNRVVGAFCAACATGEDYRLRQPSLFIDHQFQKIQLLADNDPSQGHTHLFHNPLPLSSHSGKKGTEAKGEKLEALIQNAVDEPVIIGVMLSTHPISYGMLDVEPDYIIHGEGDTNPTVLRWTNCAITWDQDLPKGTYVPIGMKVGLYPTTTGIARINCPGATDWRPGVPCALTEASHKEFQSVTWNPWNWWPFMPKVNFTNVAMPNIELLCTKLNVADTIDQDVELAVKKVA